MSSFALDGPGRIANWVLACVLAASIAGNIFLALQSPWLGGALAVLGALLLLGVLFRSPLAYLGIATLAVLGLASALLGEDLLVAALQAVLLGLALFVRGRLRILLPRTGEE
jgi:hypothetical protein